MTKVRQLIREQQQKFGSDLFKALTDEEKDLLAVIASGAAELQQIVEESLLSEARAQKLITALVKRGYLEAKSRGGEGGRRGASVKMYFVTAKFRPPLK